MMLGAGFLFTALYFRAAWEVRFIPAFARSPVAQLLFYPAVTLPDAASSSTLHQWAFRLAPSAVYFGCSELWRPALYLGGITLGAGGQPVVALPAQGQPF